MNYVLLLCALSNMQICCLIEMPGAERSTADEEPLSTDPAKWPTPLTDRIRTELVRRGPSKLPPDFVFQRNESDGRSCHQHYFKKTLVSGEKMARSWFRNVQLETCKFLSCITRKQSRTPQLHESMEGTGSEVKKWKNY